VLWLSALLIAAVSNLDNLAAGVAFGMRDTRIAVGPNLLIAAVTMAATAGAMTSGHALARVLSPSLAAALGAAIICTIGVWTVLASLHDVRVSARDKVITCREALTLGVALALNNVAAGVGAGVAGISPLATTALAGALSLICVGAGSRVGMSLCLLVGGRWASRISGLLLLGLGAVILSGAG
jgi:putative Mn2+ efflux pump MntP